MPDLLAVSSICNIFGLEDVYGRSSKQTTFYLKYFLNLQHIPTDILLTTFRITPSLLCSSIQRVTKEFRCNSLVLHCMLEF